MKPEKIITALNDIDGQFIREAHESAAVPRKSARRFAVLIAAVIALMALAVTAFASEQIASWFKAYFEKQAGENLTSEQIQFIEENEQMVEEAQLQNNCTIELKSFMTDGQYMCMILGITVPDGMKIEDACIGNFGGHPGIIQPAANLTLIGHGQFMRFEDDGDSKENTANIVFEAMFEYEETEKPFDKGTVWNLHIEDLTTTCVNEEYLSQFEIVDGGFALSAEEAAIAYQTLTLAEGTWDYQFTVEDGDFREIEIALDEPVVASTVVGVKPMEDGSYPDYWENVTITAVTLRSMGLTFTCEEYPTFSYTEPCKVVLNDGSSIEVVSYWSKYYYSTTPIVIDEVDHILLADGTKITVP